MPNWVKNRVVFDTGKAAARVVEDCKGENTVFDFNKLIPKPESLDIVSGSATDEGTVLYQAYHGLPIKLRDGSDLLSLRGVVVSRVEEKVGPLTKENIDKWCEENGRELLELGEAACKNYQQHGARTWYEWCPRHWGTKWNACQSSYDGARTITFDTAWSMPRPILEALRKKYPDISLTWTFADEDMGCNCGTIHVQNGKVEEDFPESGSSAAYEVYVECWGASGCLGRDENGNYVRHDCDDCPAPC